jgi:glutathione S-transferase
VARLKIILGNKNYSSWSLRAWIVLKQLGVDYEETVVPLDQPNTREEISRYSPSGRVPALIDGDVTVWDSLAICEYLNERFPDRRLWPADAKERAHARSVSAEMHSGFQALREHFPMKFRETIPTARVEPQVRQDIQRILAIWNDCRKRHRKGGPFLFGAFTIADGMYAPVVSRFKTYGVQLEGDAAAYAETIWNLPSMQDWLAAARAEPYSMGRYEQRAH